MSGSKQATKPTLMVHLVAGGAAGLAEAMCCHPLDTIKVRMQLRSSRRLGAEAAAAQPKSFLGVGQRIVQREGVRALYKGLGAVVTGIVPKMAIRFSSFELYKSWLANGNGHVSTLGVFVAGLGAGVTEAVAVVTPMDVIKIRLQAQRHSTVDPLDVPKYRNAMHAAFTIVKEEGPATLYKGVALTALRQATNQAVNFTFYQEFKRIARQLQSVDELPSYQHLILGGVSGAMGPISNAPIDTIKTRIQKSASVGRESGWTRFVQVTREIAQKEGYRAFYRGLTPRVLRVAPGQAITFMVYEKVKSWIDLWNARSQHMRLGNEKYA
ncbi:Mitochondrial succinate-fumarate transporter [Coemansia sp. RSA 2706]|nr:Mitochondrial succinate-fumarate transporter [Coemansia sp. RSA 2711]KAJ1838094.1 Mitochondrial succinate-fumarate transporter [Coemansia sp. RSA 2708]KAJ2304689.1 Mitochondrial succinate-fumarate transporter [Coemansia sp. RSA 2706]KAJ2311852.1 Mitochondrial succinate-fumarate transporter [Coemansia sp. RSA 2705]KAJ2317364.1 Mitochondrial succinate-fumarate transporter [Coemansia sp. RSA 2704]KAJ2318105.1 Mitochondrial succinate-fumarate transporter [Coemansia sp. RSA 2702]KAJ2365103.1 Mi